MRLWPFALCLLLATSAPGQQPPSAEHSPTQQSQPDTPLPDPAKLLLEVEANQRKAEAIQRDYTYKVRMVNTELNSNGSVKKTTTTEADSFTIDGVRVNKVFARNGKPLSDDEKKKEDDALDKQVAKAKQQREKLESKGQATNAQGVEVITVARILELGTFSNIRPSTFANRPVWLVDYAGDPHAKTRSEFEGVIKDLVGTVWIDQADKAIVAAHGEFRADFKIGFGLLANIHKGTHFDFRATKVDATVWLPHTIDAEGSMRYLLFAGFNGKIHVETSDYKRFRTTIKLIPGQLPLDENGNPLPDPKPN